MINELEKFLNKHYGTDFKIKSYESKGKDHFFELDFGDDEVVAVRIRERKGDNGNYRIVSVN